MPAVFWRWLERRLARVIARDRLSAIIGDLHADYEQDAHTRGAFRARVRLWRESLSLLAAYRATPWRQRGISDRLRLDLRQAWRAIAARPGATVGTVSVLALGIGLVSSMFALADPYVTRPLPFADAGRIVTLSVAPSMFVTTDLPTVEAWQARRDLFDAIAVVGESITVLARGDRDDVTLRLLPVDARYLSVLRTSGPPLVDWRAPPDARQLPVVLTAAAARRLGGAPATAILATVDDAGARTGHTLDVRGHLPESFLFPTSVQVWDGLIPVPDDTPLVTLRRTPGGLTVPAVKAHAIARLARGVSAAQVAGVLSTSPSVEEHRMPTKGYLVRASRVVDDVTARLRPLATGALAAGLLVLVVCAANVSSLLIARGVFRSRELATREALGATRGDLSRLASVELGLIAALGIASGLFIARLAIAGTALVIPQQYVVLGVPSISLRVVGFACLAGVTVMLAGLASALAAWRVRPGTLFQQSSAVQPKGIRSARMSLTAAQIAVAVVFLVGAMLLARSYANLLLQDPGYSKDMFAVGVRYANSEANHTRREQIEATAARLRQLDGVGATSIAIGPIVENISGGSGGAMITVDGVPSPGLTRRVRADFFQTAGGRLLEGRLLTSDDERRAVVVSESFARECCASRSAVGRLAVVGRDQPVPIVGVVKDVLYYALDNTPPPTVFVPIDDSLGDVYSVTYVLQVNGPTAALAGAIDTAVHAESPQAVIADASLMRDRLMRSIRDRSFATLIVCFFAIAAIGVSAAGIVGVVGSVVARRTREIAIRVALGADRTDVGWLVTAEAALASAIGAVAGFTVAAWLSKTLSSLLFGVSPSDPIAMALAAGLLVAIVAGAAWWPARRAVKLSPTDALRIE